MLTVQKPGQTAVGLTRTSNAKTGGVRLIGTTVFRLPAIFIGAYADPSVAAVPSGQGPITTGCHG